MIIWKLGNILPKYTEFFQLCFVIAIDGFIKICYNNHIYVTKENYNAIRRNNVLLKLRGLFRKKNMYS